jgi:hypothetical protein
MEMAYESRSVVEALDRIRGALAPFAPHEDSESVIMALDRIYDVLKPPAAGTTTTGQAPPTADEAD